MDLALNKEQRLIYHKTQTTNINKKIWTCPKKYNLSYTILWASSIWKGYNTVKGILWWTNPCGLYVSMLMRNKVDRLCRWPSTSAIQRPNKQRNVFVRRTGKKAKEKEFSDSHETTRREKDTPQNPEETIFYLFKKNIEK